MSDAIENARLLGNIDGKVTLILDTLKEIRHERDEDRKRITALERRRYMEAGAASVLGGVIYAVTGHVVKWPF